MPFPISGAGFQIGDGNEAQPNFFIQAEPVVATTAITATAAQLAVGLFVGTPAGGVALTLPTVAALETAMQSLGEKVNVAFLFSVISLAAQAITVTTNTGWTLVGGMAVNNTSGRFLARKTGRGTWTLYRL